ncbi:hypothetical protein Trydic_g12774 [Trypoxylus dichotomus]
MRAVNCCLPIGEAITLISNFEPGRDNSIAFEDILLEDLSKSNKVSYILKKINDERKPAPYNKHIGAYIIYLSENLNDLRRDLMYLSAEKSFDPHAKFFMVATDRYTNFSVAMQYAANLIWEFKLANAVGFIPEESKMETYNVYIGHIYGMCGEFLKPHKIDECTHGKASRHWFIDNIPKNLNGCLLEVRTSIIEPFVILENESIHPSGNYNLTDGLEVKLVNTIAQYINVTVKYSVTQSTDVYGEFYPNSSFSGSYLDLSNKKIDLIVGYVVSRPETQQIFDTITSYFQDSLVFCVAHAKRLLYTTYSIKSLSTAQWEYQIHTANELSTKIVQYYPLCQNYFARQEQAQMWSLKLCEDYTECLNRTVQSDEFATCMPKLNVQYLFRNFLDENGYPRLYYFNKDIVTYPIEMLMWKGHPLKPRINEMVNRLSAGGFIYKWEKEIFDDLMLNSRITGFVQGEEIVLTLILFTCINATLIPLKDAYAHKRSLSECLMRGVNCCLPIGEAITVVTPNFDPDWDTPIDFDDILLEDLSKSNKVSYILKKFDDEKKPPPYNKHIGVYIIRLGENLDDLRRDLTSLRAEESFNPHAKFFLVATDTYTNFSAAMQYVANLLWDFKLANVVGFIPEESKKETYNVYIGHIYGTCGEFLKPYKIDECTHGKATRDWFIDNIPKNLNGCSLHVRTSVIEPFVILQNAPTHSGGSYNLTDGLEVKLLNTIAQYINATINYSMTQSTDVYGEFFANSSFSGSYLDLSNKKIDLIVGYVVSRPETQQIFDTITSYFQDSLVFCVAHAKRLPNWAAVGNTYQRQVKKTEIVYYKTYVLVTLRVVRVLFGLTENIMPRTSITRFLVLLVIVYSFFYRSAYNTFAIKFLSTTHWEYQIHTTSELITKTVQYYPLCLNYFAKQERAQIKSLELCEDYMKCLNRTVQSNEFATCMPKLNVQYLFRNFLDENGYPLLYYFNKDIVTYPIEMLMWKGHPLKPRINEMVNRLSAGGFIYKWKKEIFDGLMLNSKMKGFVQSEEVVLTLADLSVPFLTVVIGYLLTILVFIGEIWIYRRKHGKIM